MALSLEQLRTALIESDWFYEDPELGIQYGWMSGASVERLLPRLIESLSAAVESAPKAVRLTEADLEGLHYGEPDRYDYAFARAVETAVLTKNGIEVSE